MLRKTLIAIGALVATRLFPVVLKWSAEVSRVAAEVRSERDADLTYWQKLTAVAPDVGWTPPADIVGGLRNFATGGPIDQGVDWDAPMFEAPVLDPRLRRYR